MSSSIVHRNNIDGKPAPDTEATPLALSNSLPVLAARIRAEHKLAEASYQGALAHALMCGWHLIEAKEELRHGGWLKWLTESCPEISTRTARLYMQLARNQPSIESEAENGNGVANLTVRGALWVVAREEKIAAAKVRNAELIEKAKHQPDLLTYVERQRAERAGLDLPLPKMPPLPTPEQVADGLIEQLVQVFCEAHQDRPELTFEHLLAAFERRFGVAIVRPNGHGIGEVSTDDDGAAS